MPAKDQKLDEKLGKMSRIEMSCQKARRLAPHHTETNQTLS
jgi:hypothetical protein